MIIEKAQHNDLEEILSLQKLAFHAEAELFDDFMVAPLIQTIESIKEDFKNNLYLKAVHNNKIVGSIRAYEKDSICYIGRIIVHPENQNMGIGKDLMNNIEKSFDKCKKYSLFTAKRMPKNLYFYNKMGYSIVGEEKISEKLTFVYFEKEST